MSLTLYASIRERRPDADGPAREVSGLGEDYAAAKAAVDDQVAATLEAEAAAETSTSTSADASYDSGQARSERVEALKDMGAAGNALRARAVSDELNAHDPRRTAAAAAGRTAGTGRPTRSRRRASGAERGR